MRFIINENKSYDNKTEKQYRQKSSSKTKIAQKTVKALKPKKLFADKF